MSTVTSSAINKGKTVAPKAVSRRRPGPAQAKPAVPAELPTPEPSQNRTDDATASTTQAREFQHTQDDAVGGGDTAQQATASNLVAQPDQEEGTISSNTRESVSNDAGQAQAQAIAAEDLPQQQSSAPAQIAGVKRKRTTHKSSAAAASAIDHADDSDAAPESMPAGEQSAVPSAKRARGRPRKTAETNQSDDTPAVRRRGRPKKSDAVTSTPGRAGSEQSTADTSTTTDQQTSTTDGDGGAAQGAASEQTMDSTAENSTAADATGTTEEAVAPMRQKRGPRKPRKPRAAAQVTTDGEVQGDAETGEAEAEEEEAAEEEEDPEKVVIDEETTAMSALTRNRAIGKTSEREKLMAAIDWTEVARKRREESAPRAQVDAADAELPAGTPRTQTVQYRIVNGEIVVDEASTHIDRQAQAIANADLAVVDENADLTKRVNRMTWMNDRKRNPAERVSVYKAKGDPWNDMDTDRFYEALRMFGTDFEIISKMFPPRSRRQIKLKFVREERLDPERIKIALSGGQIVQMDLAHYAAQSGVEEADFKDPQLVLAELAQAKQEQMADIDKKALETAEAQKQRDLMNEQRDREKEERERSRQAQKAQRRKKKAGRGNEVFGDGSL